MSDPVARSISTSSARPRLASQAPKVRITIHEKVSVIWNDSPLIKKVIDKMIASKDRRDISKCFRWIKKQKSPLRVGRDMARDEMEIIATRRVTLPSAYKADAQSGAFVAVS